MTADALRRIDVLIGVGLRLARSAPTGRILLARIALALDPAWIPRPWGDELAAELEAALAAAREPLEWRRVERILHSAWGARPSDELDELDPKPVAVTPSSQVHRGLLDGAPVAVKVLRPGLAASVRQDLTLLDGLLAPLSAAFPTLDPGSLVREFRERVLDELDLEHEATTQRRFHRALRDHPVFLVPAPVTRLAHADVLVSEWVDGTPLWQATDRDRAAAALVLFALGAPRSGIVHADIDPADVLVLPDDRLAILDFGAARDADPERVALAAAAIEAFAAGEVDDFGIAVERLGWLPSRHAEAALELTRDVLGELAGPDPVLLDSGAVLAARDRLLARPEALTTLMTAGSLAPEDLWPARGVAQLFSTIARVGATGRWRDLAVGATQKGWDAALDLP